MGVERGRGFAGAVALVVGGGSGIGAAVCRRLGVEGATVVVADRTGAREVARGIPGASSADVDVRDSADVEAVVARVVADHGRLDVLAVTAGLDDPLAKQEIADAAQEGSFVDVLMSLDDERWRRVMSVNLDGTFHVLRAAARVMVGRGGGAIVLTGSSAAFDTLVGYPHYAASKAGVHALAQAAAKELAPHGVRVNVVAPGPVDTPMAGRTPLAVRESLAGPASCGHATAEQIADTIVYLASPGASNVVGAVLLSNGGRFTVS